MTTLSGYIAIAPSGSININDVSTSESGAWHHVMPTYNGTRVLTRRNELERAGWRVVPCKLVIEDGKP